MIDEVHILQESRGATLEVVVSRLKLGGDRLRFVALSASVSLAFRRKDRSLIRLRCPTLMMSHAGWVGGKKMWLLKRASTRAAGNPPPRVSSCLKRLV